MPWINPFRLLLTGGVLLLSLAKGLGASSPPSVALSSPLHGAFAVAPATVHLVAQASDSDGTVAKVEFFSGTNLLATVSNAPYAFSWTNVAAGTNQLAAVATDNGGLQSTSAVTTVTVLPNGAALKVMPLGDSITEGGGFNSPYPGAYRVRLWTNLVAAGLSVNFVGSQNNGPPELGDKDHEGHSGWLIGPDVPVNQNGISGSVTNWLGAAQPNVVLLMIGANDVILNYDFTNAPTRLANLIDKILTNAPNAHLIVSSLTPFMDVNLYNRAAILNDLIPGMVSARRALGKRISFVDCAKAMTRFEMTDGVHPTAVAYAKLGDFWTGALMPVLNCQSPPEVVLTSPTNNFQFAAPANLTLTATATNFNGAIRRVEFYQDAVKVGEATNAPYAVTASNLTSGRHTFTARAVGTNGAATAATSTNVQDQWQFIRGININGPALTIEGYDWLAYSDATTLGFSFPSNAVLHAPADYGFAFQPTVYDPNITTMFQRLAFAADSSKPLTFNQTLNNGSYRVYLWLLEDFADYSRSLDFRIQGVAVATNVFNVPQGTWKKFGPYVAIVTNGVLTGDLIRNASGGPALFGLTIFKSDTNNTPPILSPLPNRTIYQNDATGPMELLLADDYTSPSNLVLSVTSSDPVLAPTNQITLGGSGFSRTVSVVPAANQTGTALITLTALDSGGLTNAESFTVTVITNTAPVASNQVVIAAEDTGKTITLAGFDPEGFGLTYLLVSGPTNGSVFNFNTNSGTLTYQASANFFGSDAFIFNVWDGQLTGAVPATVSITVNPVNDAPTATGQTLGLVEETPKAITLAGTDVEGSNLTFTVVGQPSHGSISGFDTNAGVLTYTPASNYFGFDSFTFSVSDGQLTSAVATVSLTITNVNDPPTVTNQNTTLAEDSPTLITLNATDGDSTNLTFVLLTSPTNGALAGFNPTNGTVTYAPGTNFFGTDSFTFNVSDGQYTSAVPGTVSITVTAVNDPPAANAQAVGLLEETPTLITLTGFDVEGSNLTFTVVASPTNGAISGFNTNTGALTYTPNSNYFGADSFTFKVKDGSLTSAVATVSLTITNVNDAPVATPQSVGLNEDTNKAITLAGTDVDSSNLTFTVVSGPTNGALSGFDTNTGALIYTPVTNYSGTDSFTFSVSDGSLTSAVAVVSLTVTNVNDVPVASNQSVILPEDTATNLVLAGFDVEGSNLTFKVVVAPANGTISGFNTNTGALTYTPATNFFGSDSFTFSVKDGQLTSAVATVSLTITNVNDAPVASNQSLTLTEDTAKPVTLTGSDLEGSNLTFTIVGGPANGAVSGFNTNTGALTYTPATNYFGADSFKFSVSDGQLTSAVATVSLTITNVNDAPVASNAVITLAEDTATNLVLQGSDPEGSNLTFILVTAPTNGALSAFNTNTGALTYTPATNYFGTDSFTFGVKDGALTSAVATVSLTIAGVNDAPVASNATVTLAEDTVTNLMLHGSDLEGSNLTFTVVSGPANGSLSAFNTNTGTLTYTPATNYFGSDSFTFAVSDGQLTSAVAMVSLTITNLNDAPVASNATVTLAEDTATAITLHGFDVEGSNLTFILVSGPAHGAFTSLNTNTGAFTYQPASNYFGADSFTFSVSDGQLTSAVAMVSLTVTNVNDAPVATAQSIGLNEDSLKVITLTGSDVEGSNLTFTVVSGPTNGVLSGFNTNTGALIYTPATNFFGVDSFKFSVSDGQLTSAVATVSLTVTNVNDAPVASNQSLTLPEDTATPVTLHGADVEGSNLTFIVVSGPTNGAIAGFNPATGTLTYLANSNFFGADSFGFSVSDGQLTSAVATVSLTITNVNDAPVANPQSLTLAEDSSSPLTLTGSDIDSTNLTFAIVTGPTNGSLSGFNPTNGTLTYTPGSNFFGADSFTFSVSDGALTSAVASISLTVTNVNDAPTASSQNLTLAEDTAVPLTLTGTDFDSTNLTFILVTGPTNGALSAFNTNTGALTYTPATNFFGADSFTFAVSDGQLTSAVATVNLTITNVNDAPVAFNQSVTLSEDAPTLITLAGSDIDSTNLTFAIVSGPTNGAISAFNPNTGALTYTSASNFHGADSFTFAVNDGALTSAVATVSLTVTNVNDAPVASNQSLTLPEDAPTLITLAGSDIDSTNLTFAIVAGPTNGAISAFNPNTGTLTYTSASNFHGADSFTFAVNDGALTSAVATVSLTITNVDDPAVASNLTFIVTANTNHALALAAVNPDGHALAFAFATLPTNGLLTALDATNGAFTYTPAHAFAGGDKFTFTVTDALLVTTGTVNLVVQSLSDGNSNGIPDAWETAHFGSPFAAPTNADSDGDGLSNFQEYLADTDPHDPRSALLITTVQVNTNGHFLVTWNAVGGVRYRLRFSNGATNGGYNGAFAPLPRTVIEEMCPAPLGTPAVMNYTDDFSLTGPPAVPGIRYFRVEAVR